MTHWFPDNSVIVNFGHIDRLELLQGHLRDNGRVTQAVSAEILSSAMYVPALNSIDQREWFGDVIEVEGDNGAVEGIRVHRFGGNRYHPKQHLGESETLYVIQFLPGYRDSIWITEDKSAYQFATKNGIAARNTFDVFKEMVAFGELTSTEAFGLMCRLDQLNRLFYCPTSAAEFDAH